MKLDKQFMEINYSEIGISDNFMFGSIMSEERNCLPLLEQILNVHIDHIEFIENERTVNHCMISHSVRLDLYVDDGRTIYNCEMQTTNKHNLPKRSRYYQGQIDLSLLKPGEDYNRLKKCFVIFICTFDPFGEGRYIYTFTNMCKESPQLELRDEAIKIFLNTKGIRGEVTEEFKELLHFFDSSEKKNYQNSYVNQLVQEVEKKRSNQEWRHDYMTWAQMQNEIREEGREEGREQEVFNSVYENDYSAERGAQKLNIELTVFDLKYKKWKEKNKNMD